MPECKRCEATNRNRIEGRGCRGEPACEGEAQRYDAYGKCGACAPTVHALTWGDLPRMLRSARQANPEGFTPGHQEPGAVASCPLRDEEIGSNLSGLRSARRGDTRRDAAEVSKSHSRRPGVGAPKGRV
jgi:hypothetical protein